MGFFRLRKKRNFYCTKKTPPTNSCGMTDPPSRIPLSVYMHGADFRSSRGPPASETSTSSTAPPPPSVPAPVSIPTASARVPPPGPITCDNSDGKDDGEFAETVVYLREDSKKLSFPQKDKTGNNAPVTVMAIIVRRKTRPPKVYLCTRDVGDCLGYSPPKAAIQCAIKGSF